ncbi:MAG: hypothetical protein OSJ58_09350 [Dysosmobacter sp.]|nr:hypothetical protein [Dysosmobacter sp.]
MAEGLERTQATFMYTYTYDQFTVFFYGDHVFIGRNEYPIGQCCVDVMNLNEAVLKKLRVGSRCASLPLLICSQKRQTAPRPLHRKGRTLSGISYLHCLSTGI